MVVLHFAFLASAQDSLFLFDPNGNLQAQTAEIIAPPQILGQPQNRTVAPGEATSFFVVAADTRALAYQWRFNGTNIGGANGDVLLLQNVSTNNEGEYRVVLTNPSGSVTSAPALLWIDSDADGMPDSWERTFFGNLTNSATTDFDRDGSSNVEEFLNGTDPANSNSVRFRLTVLFDGGSVLKVPDQSSYTNGQTLTLTATASSNETFHAWLGDIVMRSNPVSVVMTNNKTVYARFTPSVFTWTNPGSGDWNVAANWDPGLAPGLNDNVIIAKSVTVTLNTSVDCTDVTLGDQASTPTLTGSGTLNVRGDLFWAGGTMSGNGRTIIEPGATLIVNNTSSLTLSGRTLENGGTVQFTGSGSLGFNSGAVITNRPGAVFNFESEGAFGLGGFAPNGRIDNAGTFRKSAGTGTSTVVSGLSFNNSGMVEIQSGTLALFGGGTHSGSFDVPGGTALILSGTHTANASSAIAGSGQLTFTGGTANLAGLVNVSGSNTFSGGTANFTGDYFANNNTITISGSPGGTANFNGTGVVAPAVLDFSNGTLGGSNLVTVVSRMIWSGGTMNGGGRTVLSPGATLSADIPSLATLSGRTLENGGTIRLTGSGSLALNNGAVITNRPGAVFNFENEGAFGLGGLVPNGRLDNAGTFRKSAGTGTSTVVSGLGFDNSGTVEIQTGTLSCNGAFTNDGVVNLSAGTTNRLAAGGSATGTFSAPASALAEWTGGTYTLNAGAQLNGTGLYRLNGGALTVNPNLIVENLDLIQSSSSLSGPGAVTVAGAMNWTAGTMSGSGRTIISAGVLLNLALSTSATLARTLENGGTVLWTGAVFGVNSGGVITNRAGALFRAESEAANGLGGVPANGRFDNAGTFRKSAGVGTTTVASGMKFTNYNTVDIGSGILAANGGYVSSSNARFNCALGGTAAGAGYGQLQVAGAVTLNGALSVEFINGFVPKPTDTFTVLTGGTREGTFANFFYPSNAVTMQWDKTANSAIVRVTGIAVPELALLPLVITSSNVMVCWLAESNKIYTLEYTPDLSLANWEAVPGNVVTSGDKACQVDGLTSSNRFYRVRFVP